jgi:hypothetical protein
MIKIRKSIIIYIIVFILLIPSFNSIQAYEIIENKEELCSIESQINDIIEDIDQQLIETFLSDLVSFGPRMTGTYGCYKAGNYIREKFDSFNLKTTIQNWTSFGNKYNPRWFKGFNVIGTKLGSDLNSKLDIVFNAHYDSVKVSPGADDDGSGVAAILAIASVLQNFNFSHTIHFVCFSGEEQGLLGSKAYGDMLYETNKEKVIIEFNADGIGYSTSESANTFRLWGTEDVSWLMDVIDTLNQDYNIGFTLDKRTLPEDGRGGSDYFSFVRYGIDSIAFFEGAWNPYWHSEDDTIEHMDLAYLTKATKLIASGIVWLLDTPLTHPFVYIESPMKGYAYFEGRIKKPLKDTRNGAIRTIVFDDIWIWAQVFIDESLIEKVELYVQGRLIETDYNPPYKFHLNRISFFKQRLEVIAYHIDGRISTDWMDVYYLNLLRVD